ncbi:TetR/AcrR family transcriptional regulator [Eggerthella guodeyinii]|uniref:TetR family transcriptional regulator n=1 Tax=Eggerthella guodeyinii TaxID=2690837 RepID=A0A6N7RRH1_9ACTN|nr:TetR/AcrR family transcriptional regulator [Eggerthella guodeyinii]MRX83784.1 TetR family transcriptional regulator [Eggerthella guodeyinii]
MPKSAEQCAAMRDEMRERILRESLRYFARNGFAGTKVADLARGIGIAQGTIYRYFDSKEDLFCALRTLVANDEDVRELKLLARLPLTAKAKIRRLAASVLDRLADDELFAASVVLNTQLMLEEGLRDGLPAPYRSELYAHTARIVEQGQREGSVAAGDPLKLADFFWGVAYLYALKRLFTTGFDMIDAADMERTLLKGGR